MARLLFAGCLATMCAAFTGCPQTSSCNVTTNGIWCNFQVVEQQGVATATAIFRVGGPGGTLLSLGAECGDDITVNGHQMVKDDVTIHYTAILDPAETYVFLFTRADKSEYQCSVNSPPPVTITAPASESTISRGDGIAINWEHNDNQEHTVHISVAGSCTEWLLREGADTGEYSINPGEIQVLDSMADAAQCDVELSVIREHEGAMSLALKGIIQSRTIDTVWFTSVE